MMSRYKSASAAGSSKRAIVDLDVDVPPPVVKKSRNTMRKRPVKKVSISSDSLLMVISREFVVEAFVASDADHDLSCFL